MPSGTKWINEWDRSTEKERDRVNRFVDILAVNWSEKKAATTTTPAIHVPQQYGKRCVVTDSMKWLQLLENHIFTKYHIY